MTRILLATTLLLMSACSTTVEDEPMASSADKPSHHRSDGGFRNPLGQRSSNGLGSFLKARFFDEPWASFDADKHSIPTASPALADATSQDNATVTWVGHATVLIQHQGINVLTDPVFSDYASPVQWAGPKRVTKPALSLNELPPIHAVVISHDHYDHLDVASIKALGNEPMYYVPLGIGPWLIDRGIDSSRIVERDWWQSSTLTIDGRSVEFTATPAQHFSGRGLSDGNSRLWASWGLAWSDFTAWFGGDTGYNDSQFVEIGERLGPIDFAVIPIGAYRPRWFMKVVHVDPAEAVLIHQDIGAAQSMGIHWGAFILSAEEADEPPRALAEAMAQSNLPAERFDVYAVGETRHLATRRPEPATN
ncbi:MAG: MBL fold metallo-hydrolase [Pseudomonadaceae bacterium]|nr:MBL fold metallo-hydrolase [Pseudomonadaceae bacterium]